MTQRVDLYDSTYGQFTEQVLAAVRAETFGEDIGQNSWITADEFDTFLSWLPLSSSSHVLEIACGSGGPALHLARKHKCRVTGVDINDSAVATATQAARAAGLDSNVRFQIADANKHLPFDDETFDAILCIDSINHLPSRFATLREWYRLLKRGRRILFTDPVIITGPVSNEELAVRSSIGYFLFLPPETNERFIFDAGFRLVRQQDVTANAAIVSGRWREARYSHRADLTKIEGEERFEGLQKFFSVVHRLASERRLSRYVYVAEK